MHRISHTEAAAEAIRAYVEETNRRNQTARTAGMDDQRELKKVRRTIKELVTLAEEGGGSRALLARLRELEAREDEINARLAEPTPSMPNITPMSPTSTPAR